METTINSASKSTGLFDPEIDDKKLRALEEVAESEDRSLKAAQTELNTRIQKSSDIYGTKLVEQLGADKYNAYKRFRDQEGYNLKKLVELENVDINDPKLVAERTARTNNFFLEMKIDTKLMDALQKEKESTILNFLERERKAASPALTARDFPEEIATQKSASWSYFKAPFQFQQYSYNYHERGSFFESYKNDPNSYAGTVSNKIDLINYNAGDYSYALADLYSQVGVKFRTTQTARIEIWVRASNVYCHNYLWLRDEYGYSRSLVWMNNMLTTHFIHPTLSGVNWVETNHFSGGGNPDPARVTQANNPGIGAIRVAHFFSNNVVPAGEDVVIRFGTRDLSFVDVNDVSVNAKSYFWWNITDVFVRSEPV